MNTTDLIAIIATSLLCIAAVPSVLSFSGYGVINTNRNYATARNQCNKCFRTQHHSPPVEIAYGANLRHCVLLQMTDEESADDIVENKSSRVSKRMRVVNVFRRVFGFAVRRRSLSTEQPQDELQDGAVSITEVASVKVFGENQNESLETVTPSFIGDTAMELADDHDVDDGTVTNTTTPISRQATAFPNTDLSGTWSPIVTSTFKSQYDDYLKNCSQSFVFRKVIVNGIEYQRETIRQLDNGRNLEINAQNPAGNWNRTLVASDIDSPIYTTMVDPDKDTVNVEAWWEDNGTKHKSVLRGKPRLNGGVFETVRYLDENDKDVLICESTFLPSESGGSNFKLGHVLWRFQRVAEKR